MRPIPFRRGTMSDDLAISQYDASPDDALAAIRVYEGPVIADLDETLYLRNSTQDFIDCAWPGPLALLLLRVLEVVKPWRLTGGLRIRSGIVHLGTVVVALAIAWGVGAALTDAVGQPITTMHQREQANDPSSLKPQSSQPAPVEVPSSGESSAPAGLSAERLCDELRSTALQNDLPTQFFTQLIWQESHFNTSSVSRAGAQGIAQFMPTTAYERKLADPFEPIHALHEAARLLNELHTQFGNLGLAAAAYNAGPHRVRQWLAGRGHLPGETRAYVQAVTGHSVEDWAASRASGHADLSAGSKPCSEIAGLISAGQVRVPAHPPASMSSATGLEQTVAAPWGLQLIGDSSEVRALSAYRALQQRFPEILGDRDPLVLRTPANGPASWYRVRVAETTLQHANELCARLRSAGASCLVQPISSLTAALWPAAEPKRAGRGTSPLGKAEPKGQH
jgi:hypothetical protein